MEDLEGFKSLMSKPRKVVIVTHFKPDADALGSSLGLAGFLKKKGHTVQVITPSDYPSFLSWMPGNEEVLAIEKNNSAVEKKAQEYILDAEVIFCLDFSSLNRINTLGEMVREAKATKVLIDHHLEPEHFAHFEHWNSKAASTAGLVFDLIDMLGEKSSIDKNIANCLYAGLLTDTGGFRHSNTTQKEFLIASELVGAGANPSWVSKKIYDTNTLARMKLTGFVLSQKLMVLPEYRTVYICLNTDELKQFDTKTGDTEGLVNYGLSIEGIKLSVLMYDRKEEIKLSFRSLGNFPANEIARKYFEGGGHRNAAGGSSKLSLEETLKKFLSILPDYKLQLEEEDLI
ncbi:MAG: bifunctional oligoribonuclease/PAP phosphatase NrnA [Cyclobacteriaceae bacterium]|nr:bifunctional oligoribonuclease/PAP phosphatase NrnA [Cyclobacteriaceae bacterium]